MAPLTPSLVLASLLLGAPSDSLSVEGSIVSWPVDQYDVFLNAPADADIVQVATGDKHVIALRTDGSILYWGYGGILSQTTPTGAGFTRIATGGSNALALRGNGAIVAWGIDNQGQTSGVPAGIGFTEIDCGLWHCMALRADGSIVSWGHDYYNTVTGTPSGTGFTQIAGGYQHSLALRADGSIVSWGRDDHNEVSGTPVGTGFIHITAGTGCSMALRADGSIVAWGWNTDGQVSEAPTETGFTQLAVGDGHALGLRRDGTIAHWGMQIEGIPAATGYTQIAANYSRGVALGTDVSGVAFCFGHQSSSPCPCGNNGNYGAGCANSNGQTGATLRALGVPRVQSDTFQLEVVGLPVNEPGLILMGPIETYQSIPIGDGLLCVGGLLAYSQFQLSTTGTVLFSEFNGRPFGLSSFGAGISTRYQYWYRDQNSTCSGSEFNFSNAWSVQWEQ